MICKLLEGIILLLGCGWIRATCFDQKNLIKCASHTIEEVTDLFFQYSNFKITSFLDLIYIYLFTYIAR